MAFTVVSGHAMLDAVSSVPDIVASGKTEAAGGARPDATAPHHVSFHDVLSALNPLQYLPVIGTIYRAVTGDQIAEPVRRIGSMIASGLMGGPIGVAVDLVMLAAEKVTGLDLDKGGQMMVARAGKVLAGGSVAEAVGPVGSGASAGAQVVDAGIAAVSGGGMSASRVGGSAWADSHGADVLNTLELSRIQAANAAYGRTMVLAV
jgi:hypothetical protein